MKKIGITGGIGSGKTTICKFFELLNIPIYYADETSKYLLNNNLELKHKLIENFGNNLYDVNGLLNRSFFAKIIFSDKKLLEKANSIIHPIVRNDYKKWCETYKHFDYTIEESAILFESEINKDMDFVITVYTPINERIARVSKRDNLNKEQIMDRIKNQLPDEYKIKNSDFVIDNSNNVFIIPQIIEIDKKIITFAKITK